MCSIEKTFEIIVAFESTEIVDMQFVVAMTFKIVETFDFAFVIEIAACIVT